MSRLVPNTYQTPTYYTTTLLHLLRPNEFAVLMYTCCRLFTTWPQRSSDRIPLIEFIQGRGEIGADNYGPIVDYGTGLSRDAVIAALSALVDYRILLLLSPNDKAQNNGAEYTLQLNHEEIDLHGLRQRDQERFYANQQRTAAAREAKQAAATPQAGSDQVLDQDQASTLETTESVTPEQVLSWFIAAATRWDKNPNVLEKEIDIVLRWIDEGIDQAAIDHAMDRHFKNRKKTTYITLKYLDDTLHKQEIIVPEITFTPSTKAHKVYRGQSGSVVDPDAIAQRVTPEKLARLEAMKREREGGTNVSA